MKLVERFAFSVVLASLNTALNFCTWWKEARKKKQRRKGRKRTRGSKLWEKEARSLFLSTISLFLCFKYPVDKLSMRTNGKIVIIATSPVLSVVPCSPLGSSGNSDGHYSNGMQIRYKLPHNFHPGIHPLILTEVLCSKARGGCNGTRLRLRWDKELVE